MKLIIKSLFVLISIFSFPFFIQSCSDSEEPYSVIFGTVQLINDDDYYFLLDIGKNMYPGDKSQVSDYKAEEGQRVLIFFRLMDQKINGYDYNAEIVLLDDLLMKDIISANEYYAEEIGDDPINITYAWFAGNCINIEFQFMGTNNTSQKHLISLVEMDPERPQVDENGFLELELRHNAYDDYPQERLSGLIAFKQPDELENKYKGIRVYFNSIYEGDKFYDINLEKIKAFANNSFPQNVRLYQ